MIEEMIYADLFGIDLNTCIVAVMLYFVLSGLLDMTKAFAMI